MDSGTVILALLRGAHLAALLSLFGALLFARLVVPPARRTPSKAEAEPLYPDPARLPALAQAAGTGLHAAVAEDVALALHPASRLHAAAAQNAPAQDAVPAQNAVPAPDAVPAQDAAPAQNAAVALHAALARLGGLSLVVALGLGIAWFAAAAAVVAAAHAPPDVLATLPSADGLAALPAMTGGPWFGRFLALRLALLLAAAPLLRRQPVAAILLTGLALSLQPALSHAGAQGGANEALLRGSDVLHVLAAGVWFGGVLAGLVCIGRVPPPQLLSAGKRFTPIALGSVGVIAVTGWFQADRFIGSIPALLGTGYGWMMLLKLGLFVAALGLFAVAPGRFTAAPGLLVWAPGRFAGPPGRFAAASGRVAAASGRFAGAPGRFAAASGLLAPARLRVAGRLAGGRGTASIRGHLRPWIGFQTAIGLAIVLAAGALASMTPAIQQQPLWPFPWRLTFAGLDDPDIRVRVALALVAAGVGVAGTVLGLLWRRARIALLVFGACLLAAAAPTVRLLLVEAYPTSYYRSPTGFAATSITHGADIFAANCAPCHGTDGRGDGALAGQLPLRPADLTAAHLWGHSDGELFWWVSNGRPAPDGRPAMPAFAPGLSDADRWSVIDFVRANNAGTSERDTGAWVVPIAAPALPVVCAGLAADDMRDLHGSVVRVVADGAEDSGIHPPAIPPQEGYRVVILHLRGGSSQELRGGSSRELRGGSSQELRGGSSRELRQGASQELRQGASQERRQGPSRELPQGASRELGQGASRALPTGECMAATSAAWGAYATLAGLPADALAGAEFLVDPNGWLRAAWSPESGRGWSTPDQLIARVRLICTHPIAIETGGGHEHRD